MKKIVLIMSVLVLIVGLGAIEFDISGESRTRAAFANNWNEDDGAWVDGRVNLFLDSQLHQDLEFHMQAEIGDFIWGNGGASVGINESFHIKEAYIDYSINAIGAKIKFGLMEWADRNSLVLDDSFAGFILSKELGDTFNAELGFMKTYEGWRYGNDDNTAAMLNLTMDGVLPIGLYGFMHYDHVSKDANYTVMPYVALDFEPITLDITAFMDLQKVGDDTEMGLGGAVRAGMDLGMLEVNADVLMATKHGLSTISPYYMNGLYIYGYGAHHDGLTLYWDTPYEGNADLFMSLVGGVKANITEKFSAFGNAGYLIDTGMEVNAGVEYELIPDLFGIAGYGALGVHDNDTKNYAIGTTLNLKF